MPAHFNLADIALQIRKVVLHPDYGVMTDNCIRINADL